MSQKQPKNVEREVPSTKARSRSYDAMRKLWKVLENLELFSTMDGDIRDYDFVGWKRWANTHTPPDKRGGPSEH